MAKSSSALFQIMKGELVSYKGQEYVLLKVIDLNKVLAQNIVSKTTEVLEIRDLTPWIVNQEEETDKAAFDLTDNLGALDFNRQISTNIDDSSDPNDSDRMDSDVAQLWQSMLMNVYPKTNPQLQPPEIHDWHNAMRRMVKLGESGNMLFPFARHVAVNQGLVYPVAPEAKYIQGLDTPLGTRMDFEDIFQMALNNVLELWGWILLAYG